MDSSNNTYIDDIDRDKDILVHTRDIQREEYDRILDGIKQEISNNNRVIAHIRSLIIYYNTK